MARRFFGLVNMRGPISTLAHTMGLAEALVYPVSRIVPADDAPPSDRAPPVVIRPHAETRAPYVPATLFGTPEGMGMTAADLDIGPRRLRPI